MAKMRLKRVGVLAVAAWHGLYTFIFAVFIGAIYSAYAYLMGYFSSKVLLYYLVGFPVVYCPIGFITYALVAAIYNAVAGTLGGVPLELEDAAEELPPPPPHYP